MCSTAMIASSEIGPDGEVCFNRPPADQRFLEPYSGLYFQISGAGARRLPLALAVGPARCSVGSDHTDVEAAHLRQRRVPRRAAAHRRARRRSCPASTVRWRFQVAAVARRRSTSRSGASRSTLVWSFAVLGIGLLVLAALQTWSTASGRCAACAARSRAIRSRQQTARSSHDCPREVQPLVEEIERSCSRIARRRPRRRARHAGNLAHALKTPLTVHHQRRHRPRARSRRHGAAARRRRCAARSTTISPAPARSAAARSAHARANGLDSARGGRARGRRGSIANVTVDIAGDHEARRSASSGRTSTRCSAI